MQVSQALDLLLLFSRSSKSFDTTCRKIDQQHRPDVRRNWIHIDFHIWTVWLAKNTQESQEHKPSDWKWGPCAHRYKKFVKDFTKEPYISWSLNKLFWSDWRPINIQSGVSTSNSTLYQISDLSCTDLCGPLEVASANMSSPDRWMRNIWLHHFMRSIMTFMRLIKLPGLAPLNRKGVFFHILPYNKYFELV